MSDNTVATGLKLNYSVILDNIAATENGTSATERGTSVLRELQKIQTQTKGSLEALVKVNERLVTSLQLNLKSMGVLSSGFAGVIRALKVVAPKGRANEISPIINQFQKEVFDNLASQAQQASVMVKLMMGVYKSREEAVDDFLQTGLFQSNIKGGAAKKKKAAGYGLNPFASYKNLLKSGAKDAGSKGLDATGKAIGKIVKPITSMGKSMTKMAIITQPLMGFFEGLLGPFQILSKILKAFGAALGAQLVPQVMQMVKSMVKVFPLLEIIIPLIFEGIAAIAVWIGYGSQWLEGLSDANTATAELSGNLPVLSGTFQSVNVYADNTADSMTELSDRLGLAGKDIADFSLNPITLEIDALGTKLAGYKIDTSNMDQFFSDLQNKADGLSVDQSKNGGLGDITPGAGAVGGAIIGTAIAPGIGTLIGAGIGALWGWLD